MINSLLKQLADERLLKQTLKAEHAGASALDHVISSFKWPKAGEAFEREEFRRLHTRFAHLRC